MKSQVRNIVITCICLAVLGGAAFFIPKIVGTKKNVTSSVSSTSLITVYDAKSADVVSLHVQNEKGQFTLNRKSDTEWTVVEALAAPIAQTKPTAAVDSIAPIKAAKIVEQKTDDSAKYGLDKPTITTKVKYKNEEITLIYGKQSPDKSGTYFQKVGTDTIYLSDNSESSYFLSDYKQFIDTAVYTIDSEKIPGADDIKLGGTKRDYAVEIKKVVVTESNSNISSAMQQYMSTHYMVKPIEYDVNPDKFHTYLTGIATISATDVLTPDMSNASLKNYGLDNPSYTMSFTLEGKNYALKFGTEQSDGSFPFIYNDVKVIYSLAKDNMTNIKMGFSELASKMILLPDIKEVKSVTLTGAINQKIVLDVVSEDEKSTVKMNGNTVDLENFKSFYQVVIGVVTQDLATRPQGVNPYLTVKYEYKDTTKKADVIEFIPINAQKQAVVKNGDCKSYAWSAPIEKIVSDYAKLLAGQKINT